MLNMGTVSGSTDAINMSVTLKGCASVIPVPVAFSVTLNTPAVIISCVMV